MHDKRVIPVATVIALVTAACAMPSPEYVEVTREVTRLVEDGEGGQPEPEIVEVTRLVPQTVEVTKIVERQVTAAPPAPTPTSVPTPRPAVEPLQQLVGSVVARTDYVQAEEKWGAANLYVTYVDGTLMERLVAYRGARDELTMAQQEQLLKNLQERLKERNEWPLLLYVQPAEGTRLRLNPLHAEPVYNSSDDYYYGYTSPVRFDSVFRDEVTGDTAGFFYYPLTRADGQSYIDAERDATLEVHAGVVFLGREYSLLGVTHVSESRFYHDFYIDLLPTEPSLALLPDVVAEYITGPRPAAPLPSEFDVEVQWDLRASDILSIITVLLDIFALFGVG